MTWMHLQHWRCQEKQQSVILTLDVPEKSVNTLSKQTLEELDQLIEHYQEDRALERLLIQSGKKTGFIAGADISDFQIIADVQDIEDYLRFGQNVFAKIASMTCTTVALIHGHCFGGGMELALACDFRIVSKDGDTKLALPELKLGIFPGWGGTVRLAQCLDPVKALQSILSSRSIDAKEACRLGLACMSVPRHLLVSAGMHLNRKTPMRGAKSWLGMLCHIRAVRYLVASISKKKLAKKGVLASHYPAYFSYLNHWCLYGASDHGYKGEVETVAGLLLTPQAQALVRLFFLKQQLKVHDKSSRTIHNVHVIGAGVMGCEIAAVAAYSGFKVSLHDASSESLEKAYRHMKKIWPKHCDYDIDDQLYLDIYGDSIRGADLVVEAVPEVHSIKQDVLHRAMNEAPKTALIATNTSSITLEELLPVMDDPDRFVGIHFFNPVHKMPLVEVVTHSNQQEPSRIRAAMWVQKLSKFPLKVKSSPGFLVNRILIPYLLDAMTMVDEGFDASVIDDAMRHYGMPMGPLRLCDEIGLDICSAVGQSFRLILNVEVPRCLQTLVQSGSLGKKSGKGFFCHPFICKVLPKSLSSEQQCIQSRLEITLLNQASSCLAQDIVTSMDELDAGMVFGTGYAPFRGGPLYEARQKGLSYYQKKALACKRKGFEVELNDDLIHFLREGS